MVLLPEPFVSGRRQIKLLVLILGSSAFQKWLDFAFIAVYKEAALVMLTEKFSSNLLSWHSRLYFIVLTDLVNESSPERCIESWAPPWVSEVDLPWFLSVEPLVWCLGDAGTFQELQPGVTSSGNSVISQHFPGCIHLTQISIGPCFLNMSRHT